MHMKNLNIGRITTSNIVFLLLVVLVSPILLSGQNAIPDTIRTTHNTIVGSVLGFVPQGSSDPRAVVYNNELGRPITTSLSDVLEVIDGETGDIIYPDETAFYSAPESLSQKLKRMGLENDDIPDTLRTSEEEIVGVVQGFVPQGADTPIALVYLHVKSGDQITIQISQLVELVDGQTGIRLDLSNQQEQFKPQRGYKSCVIGCGLAIFIGYHALSHIDLIPGIKF